MDNFLFFLNWIILDMLYLYAFYNLFRYKKGFYRCKVSTLFLIGVLLSTVCVISADYYGYREALIRLYKYFYTLNFEKPYWYLAQFLNYDNLLFRLVLSVIIFACYAIIIKKYAINKTITIYITFIFLFFNSATLLRSSVSDGIIFLGILYYYRKRNFYSVLICCLFFSIGAIFHKSSFIVLVIFLLGFLMRWKYVRIMTILLLPIEILVVRMLVGYIFSKYFPESSYTTFEIPSSRINIVKIACNLVFFATFLITLLTKSRTMLSKQHTLVTGIYQYVFCTFVLWIVFLFSGTARFVADRLLIHASIPMTLLLSYSYINGGKTLRRVYNRYLIAWVILIQLGIFIVWLFHQSIINQNQYI